MLTFHCWLPVCFYYLCMSCFVPFRSNVWFILLALCCTLHTLCNVVSCYLCIIGMSHFVGLFFVPSTVHCLTLCAACSISSERHRAEVRRAVNDERLTTVAHRWISLFFTETFMFALNAFNRSTQLVFLPECMPISISSYAMDCCVREFFIFTLYSSCGVSDICMYICIYIYMRWKVMCWCRY